MIQVKLRDFVEGIKKVRGVVAESEVLEYLRIFRLNVGTDKINLAGTDGRITLYTSVPCINEDNQQEDFSISSDKIASFTKIFDGSDGDLEIDILSDYVKFFVKSSDGYETEFKTLKKEVDIEFNFDMLDTSTFDDEINSKDMEYILNSLIGLADTTSYEMSDQVIYLDGTKAFLYNGVVASKIDIITNKQYYFDYKLSRQLKALIGEDSIVKFKKYDDTGEIMLYIAGDTSSDIILYRPVDDEIIDSSFFNKVSKDNAIKIDKSEFTRALMLVGLISDDGEANMKISRNNINIYIVNGNGEDANKDINAICDEVKEDIILKADTMIKIIEPLKEVNLCLDVENYTAVLFDDRILSITSIDFQ